MLSGNNTLSNGAYILAKYSPTTSSHLSLCKAFEAKDSLENIALIEGKDKLAGQLPKGSSSTFSQKTRKYFFTMGEIHHLTAAARAQACSTGSSSEIQEGAQLPRLQD